MPVAQRAGVDTHWLCWGQGPRRAVLAHCTLGLARAWQPMAAQLEDVLSMTAFDMPSHGGSAAWDGHSEIQALTTQIMASFVDGPTDLIGHSFGATAAVRLAVEQPEHVRSLVLIEPVLLAAAFAEDPASRGRYTRIMADFGAAAQRRDRPAAARAFTAAWGDERPWDSLSDTTRARLIGQIDFVIDSQDVLMDDTPGTIAPGALERVDVPVLLIEGSATQPIVAEINAALARRLPDARRRVVPGAGHMVPLTHPGEVAGMIREFLAETA